MYKTARNMTVLGVSLGVSAAVGWLLLRESKREKTPPTLTVASQRRSDVEEMPQIVLPLDALDEAAQDPGDGAPDDLTQISDVGPRFAAALAAVGVTRFAQLAAQDPETLAERLAPYVNVRAARIREKNWIGQAAQLAQR